MQPRGKDHQQRQRRKATPSELRHKQLTRETAQKVAQKSKEVEERTKNAAATMQGMTKLFRNSNSAAPGDDREEEEDDDDDDDDDDEVHSDDDQSQASAHPYIPILPPPQPRVPPTSPVFDSTPDDICADYDEDEDDENFSETSPLNGSLIQRYLKNVLNTLKKEVVKQNTDRPLINFLEKNDWWLRLHAYKEICKIIKMELFSGEEPAYLRDVFVWIPDVRWIDMPTCPNCHTNTHVGPHAFRDSDYCGRRVFGLHSHFFVVSRRFICHSCKGVRQNQVERAQAAARQAGFRINEMEGDKEKKSDEEELPGYTFMGTDATSVALLPHGRGTIFHAS
jgi:hypothetical protein